MKKPGKTESADLLLEIGAEEIPAGMIEHAAEELKVLLEKYLSAERLVPSSPIVAFGTPRRLVAMCRSVPLHQPDSVREITGPPRSVAFDAQGRPTRAAESFASKQGVAIPSLYTVSTSKGDYIAARQVIPGRSAAALLSEILPRAILEIPWPRSMYWGGSDGPRFIRPIRWLVALLGSKVVPFAIAGVSSGNVSSGHRFLGKAAIPIRGMSEYERKLRSNYVIARPELRRSRIEAEIGKLLAGKGLAAHQDQELLARVCYLNEYPSVILGSFDPVFLQLPEEILITVMRDHQKYFAVRRRDGSLAPCFLAVINMDRDAKGVVRAGHERVLKARFADARFFWQTDQKCRLADNLPRLAQVTYESRLGSYEAKAARMKDLARWLAESWAAAGLAAADPAAAEHAAELSKCDLVTEMVREFTELQGIVGGLYARAQGEPEPLAQAIYDHYRPAGPDDPIPRSLTGCAVALADKLDALAGCFAVGLAPSGSSDPFALRRAALGIVRIILERRLPVSISRALATASGILAVKPPRLDVSGEVRSRMLGFLVDRARYVFRERLGFAYDEVNAVLAAASDDLVDAHRRLEALKAIRRTRNFEPLAVAFKRIRKILEKAGPEREWRLKSVSPELLSEEAERQLHAAAGHVASQAAAHKAAGEYRQALLVISGLRPVVDRFFDDVLVMAEEEGLRRNRLTLLAGLLEEFSTIADFSEIVTQEKRR